MKFLICVLLVLACSVFAEGKKKMEKRGVFGLGYGGYGHGLDYAAIAPAPLSHISQLSYSAAHYVPVVAAPAVTKVAYAAAPPLAYGHGLGYAAAPAAIVAAPAVAKIGYAAAPAIGYPGHSFEYAAPAYATYPAAPAYAKIGLGYGYHH